MIRSSGILVAVIFAALSLLHLYWALGGRWGSAVSVPSVGEKPLFNPSRAGTVLVAVMLLMAMLTILGRLGLWGAALPRWIFFWGTYAISLLFFLRAVGDFRLVGFFKRIHDTPFAYWDTRLFSPLCLAIAIIAALVAYNEAQGL
jgi:hypothetical protein